MTPEELATYILGDLAMDSELRSKMTRRIVTAIHHSVNDKLEEAAVACDAIADDTHARYKGRPPHAPDNEHRADTFTEGESSGAELCANAVRAMKVK